MKVMGRGVSRLMVTSLLSGCFVVVGAGVALAVSGGGYEPAQQDCSPQADSTTTKDAAEPGCHTFKLNVEDGNGNRYAEAGVDQMPDGPSVIGFLFSVAKPGDKNFPHSGCVAVDTNGTGGGPGVGCGTGSGVGADGHGDVYDPATGALTPHAGTPDPAALGSVASNGADVYLGADDNLDAGEHDGVSGGTGTDHSANGPSDGGAVRAHFSPQEAGAAPTPYNPVSVVGASEGFCADGFCQDVTTYRQKVYEGRATDDGSSRDVYDYQGKSWDPANCSSGSPADEANCHDATHPDMNSFRDAEAHNVYAEPGAQLYEDPDPQGSPIGSSYPIPSAYAGTCGVTVGGGSPVPPPPAGAPSNDAGQLQVKTPGC
jgi:hypothetical protein